MANPYSGNGGYGADEYNGIHGGYSPDAIINALMESNRASRGGATPYDTLLKHTTDFKAPSPTGGGAAPPVGGNMPGAPPVGGQMAPRYDVYGNLIPIGQPTSPGAPDPYGNFTTAYSGGGSSRLRLGNGTEPGGVTQPQVPGNAGTDPFNLGNPNQPAQAPPTAPTQQAVNPRTGKPYAAQNPGTVNADTWNEVDSWVQGASAAGSEDYWVLYQHPEWVAEFRQWQQANDGTKVDPVDWLAAAKGLNSSLVGRHGNTLQDWQRTHPGGGGNTQQNQTPSLPTPAGTGPSITQVFPSGVGAPPTPPPAGAPNPGVTSDQYLANLDKALRASQSQQTQEALRGFRSAAGAVGLENTGAYVSGTQDVFTNLATQFQQQREQAMLASSEAERQRAFQGGQNALDRTLQQYGLDLNAYTSRFNVQTEAGIQQAAQAMQYDLGLRGLQRDQNQLAEDIRNHNLGYNLGVGQQDLTKYQSDQDWQLRAWKLMQEIGPEAAFAQLFGQQAPPTTIPYVP